MFMSVSHRPYRLQQRRRTDNKLSWELLAIINLNEPRDLSGYPPVRVDVSLGKTLKDTKKIAPKGCAMFVYGWVNDM